MKPGNGIETSQWLLFLIRLLLPFKLMKPGNGIETPLLLRLAQKLLFQINETWKRD